MRARESDVASGGPWTSLPPLHLGQALTGSHLLDRDCSGCPFSTSVVSTQGSAGRRMSRSARRMIVQATQVTGPGHLRGQPRGD